MAGFQSACCVRCSPRCPNHDRAVRRVFVGLIIGNVAWCGVSGCSKTDKLGLKEVTGTVTYDGDPVDGAIVTLVPQAKSGRSATGTTNTEGQFKLGTVSAGDGAFPGEYNVTIRKYEVETSPYQRMTDMDEQQQASKAPLKVPKVQELLPEKYALAKTSGLTVTVEETGAKNLVFDLED